MGEAGGDGRRTYSAGKEDVHAASKQLCLLHKALELRPKNEIFIRGTVRSRNNNKSLFSNPSIKVIYSVKNLILFGIIKFCGGGDFFFFSSLFFSFSSLFNPKKSIRKV